MTMRKNNIYKIITALIVIFIILTISSAMQKSITLDEPCYINQGYYFIKENEFNIDCSYGSPPVSSYLISIFILGYDFDLSLWKPSPNNAGADMLFNSGYDADTILFKARLPIILISALFGLFVFIFAKELYGTRAGIFALMLFVFSPNILAHSRLATTDLATAFFIFIAVYAFFYILRIKM